MKRSISTMTRINEVSDVDDMETKIPSKSMRTSVVDMEIQIPTHKSTGLGSAIVPDLPEDLVIEILSRVPPKSLCRFLCVSKTWSNFIQSFKILHPMSGLFIDRCLFEPYRQIHLLFSPQTHQPEWKKYLVCHSEMFRLRTIHSCYDLILLTSALERTTNYFVYITSISMFIHINPNMPEYFSCSEKWYFPEFDSCATPLEYELGPVHCFLVVDPCESSQHFKVVRFTSKEKCIRVQLFSSMWKRWFEVTLPQEYPLCLDNWDQMSVCHRGSLYMITHSDHLVLFETETTSFYSLKLPVEEHTFCSRDFCCRRRSRRGSEIPELASCIGESRGQLYYAVNTCPQDELQIYMLNEDSGKWMLVHKNTTLQLCDVLFDTPIQYQPIAFHPESEIVYLATAYGIYSYKPNTGTPVELCELRGDESEEQEVYWTKVFPIIHYLK